MAVSSKRFLDRLDKAKFWNVQVWEFGFRSLPREYAWLFLFRAALAHPIETARGLRRYRRYIRDNRRQAPDYARFLSIPNQAVIWQHARARRSRPLVGLGFCLKPLDPENPSRSCPSLRPNHDCLYLERGEMRPVCANCAIREIGRLALEKECPVYIMTSAKDIARDFMIPQISRGLFPAALLVLCPYSIQAIILPLLICGVEMQLLPYASGSCADHEQWLKADRGIKEERTTIDAETTMKLLGFLNQLEDKEVGETQSKRHRRFRRSGNVFYPVSL